MYASCLREKEGRLFEAANPHATKTTVASQEGQDITLFLQNVLDPVTIFLATERITNNKTSLCLLSDDESSLQWCNREKNYEKTYHRVKLLSKADGHMGRKKPVGTVEKLLTIPQYPTPSTRVF